MTIEYLGEKAFWDKVLSKGHLWVAMQEGSLFVLVCEEGGVAVPVWSLEESVTDFSGRSATGKFDPVEVPLPLFRDKWLTDEKLNIREIIINPSDINKDVLVLTNEEFTAKNL